MRNTIAMDTKLTLKINKNTIEEAKKYAADQNRSLSSIIESFLQAITVKNKSVSQDYEITPFVRSMIPEQSLPQDIDETEYFEYLLKKHQ